MRELCGRNLSIISSEGKPLVYIGEDGNGDGCLRLLGSDGTPRIELVVLHTRRYDEVACLKLNDGSGLTKAHLAIGRDGDEVPLSGEGLPT